MMQSHWVKAALLFGPIFILFAIGFAIVLSSGSNSVRGSVAGMATRASHASQAVLWTAFYTGVLTLVQQLLEIQTGLAW